MAKTVILTRPQGPYFRDNDLAQRCVEEGFDTLHLSSLVVEPRALSAEERDQISLFLKGGDVWVALLSPTAAYVFRDICESVGGDLALPDVRVAVQGPGTAAVVRTLFQREVDLESTVSTAETFAEQLALRVGKRGNVLVPQSADGRDVLAPMLRDAGISVTSVATYGLVTMTPSDKEIAAVKERTPEETILLFMSPSAVRSTVATFPDRELLPKFHIVSVGPSTSKAIIEQGLTVTAEAKDHTEAGVIACLQELKGASSGQG